MDIQDRDTGEMNREQEPLVTDRISVWQQFANALTKAGSYIDMIRLRTGKSVKYIISLMVLVAVMTAVIPTVAAIVTFGGFENLFLNKIPAFRMENGELKAEKMFDIDISGVHFYVDTGSEFVDNSVFDDDSVYIAIGSRTMRGVYKMSGVVTDFYRMSLSEILPDGFDNQALAAQIPAIYLALFMNFILVILQNGIKYSLLALIYMIMTVPICKRTGLMLSKYQIFMLCFYAQTLGILLVNINAALGYLLPSFLFSMIGIFATFRYISAACFPYLRNQSED